MKSVLRSRAGRLIMAGAAIGAAAVGIATATSSDTGVIGPQNRIQPNGRKVKPTGTLTRLGNAPAGGALTTNGRFLWTLSAGRYKNDIRIVQVRPNR
jgi:hypothetical protein